MASCLFVAVVLVAFGALVDPYLVYATPRVEGFNARKPEVVKYEQMVKAYDVNRTAPTTLVLGASDVDFGIDPQYAGWPPSKRPVYNLSIQGSHPYTSYRYLQHVLSQRRVSLVIIGLSLSQFLGYGGFGDQTAFESRLAVDRSGRPNRGRARQRALDMVGTLSATALSSSVATLMTNLGMGGDINVVSGHIRMRDTLAWPDTSGSLPVFAAHEINLIRAWRDFSQIKTVDSEKMTHLRWILDLCKSRGIQVILVISPVHADLMEIYERFDVWPLWADWERQVMELAAKYSNDAAHGQVPVWDFTGFDRYSSEPVSPGLHLLKGYWEPTHYRPVVGNAIVDRIFGGDDDSFGTLLTPENLQSHQTAVRVESRTRRNTHAAEWRRINALSCALKAARDLPERPADKECGTMPDQELY